MCSTSGSIQESLKAAPRERPESSVSSPAVSSRKSLPANKDQGKPLPVGFVPGPNDVICARGKNAHLHPGNRRFRAIIRENLQAYAEAKTKTQKSKIVTQVIDDVNKACGIHIGGAGGFVQPSKSTPGRWCQASEHLAREKVGQWFRDSLHTEYKSSTKAKKRRRDEMEQQHAAAIAAACPTPDATSGPAKADSRPLSAKKKKKISHDSACQRLQELFNEANIALLGRIKKQTAAAQLKVQQETRKRLATITQATGNPNIPNPPAHDYDPIALDEVAMVAEHDIFNLLAEFSSTWLEDVALCKKGDLQDDSDSY